ncbi:cell wall-active antibiotics response protein LiaF [Bacillus sp. CGMCC 1.16607]|uniref:cell wall-active antibiotics response protein LiaF n=1 Tax=Bacillus sp. CGMCC 1.16607 TaxID=3351842 RepID=UPI00362DAC39
MRQSMNQIVFAAILLFVGIFLLLMNVGVISLEIKELIVESYPFILLLFSLFLLMKALTKQRKGSLFWGIFLLVFSTMLVLNNFKIISFHISDFWKLWPVLIIYNAILLLLRKGKVKVIFRSELPNKISMQSNMDEIGKYQDLKYSNSEKKIRGFSIGDVEMKKSNWSLEPMNLYNTIGDYFIDFSKAYIPEKETPILVQGWIGDVKMLVPDDVAVKVEAKVKIGDIRIFDIRSSDINRQLVYQTPEYDDYIKKLTIRIELKIGSVRIDKV